MDEEKRIKEIEESTDSSMDELGKVTIVGPVITGGIMTKREALKEYGTLSPNGHYRGWQRLSVEEEKELQRRREIENKIINQEMKTQNNTETPEKQKTPKKSKITFKTIKDAINKILGKEER